MKRAELLRTGLASLAVLAGLPAASTRPAYGDVHGPAWLPVFYADFSQAEVGRALLRYYRWDTRGWWTMASVHPAFITRVEHDVPVDLLDPDGARTTRLTLRDITIALPVTQPTLYQLWQRTTLLKAQTLEPPRGGQLESFRLGCS